MNKSLPENTLITAPKYKTGHTVFYRRYDQDGKPLRTTKGKLLKETETGWIIQPNRQGNVYKPPPREIPLEDIMTSSQLVEWQKQREKEYQQNYVPDGPRDWSLKQFRRLMYGKVTNTVVTENIQPTNQFEIDPQALLLPAMSVTEYEELVKSIKAVGQLEPVWTHEDKVIDGRHRLKACNELGIKCLVRQWNGECGSVPKFIIATNLNRRNLNKEQKVLVALNMLPYLEAEAGIRKRNAGLNRAANASRNVSGKLTENFPQAGSQQPSATEKPKRNLTAIEAAAKATGTNSKDIQVMKRISVESPEILDDVRAGRTTISQIRKQAVEKSTKTATPKINWKAEALLLRDILHQIVNAPTADIYGLIAEAKKTLEKLS